MRLRYKITRVSTPSGKRLPVATFWDQSEALRYAAWLNKVNPGVVHEVTEVQL